MFIGHFAIGLAAKKVTPKLSLAVLFLAVQLLDFLWPVFLLLGIEKVSVDHNATAVTPFDFSHYPYSHSLGMSILWGIVFAVILKLFKRSHLEAFVSFLLVQSHWILDYFTHRPDLPLWINSQTKYGLGLWNNVTASIIVEVTLFLIGAFIYMKEKKNFKSMKLLFLLGFLLLAYFGNIFGPKPPIETSANQIAIPGLSLWLIVLWGYWVDTVRKRN
jgi:hypothetical protein